MKLHIVSDLHIEFNDYLIFPTDADVLILAGDIAPLNYRKIGKEETQLVYFLKNAKEMYNKIVYVAGNHEFYNAKIEDYKYLKELCDTIGIHFLENETINIDGINIFGATLWTDMKMKKEEYAARYYLNDFNLILYENRVLTTDKVFDMNKNTRDALYEANPDVVITHHVPLEIGTHERYRGQKATYGFVNTEMVIPENTKLWVYGHTHDFHDFTHNGTRFVCNPKGYYEENNDFLDDFVVEI
jgi:Icc-related predicted phosphoesterase